MCFNKLKSVLQIAARLAIKTGGPILSRMMYDGWDAVKRAVDGMFTKNDLTGEEKRKQALQIIKDELVKDGKQVKDTAINFMIELAVLIKKYLGSLS